VKTTYDAWAVQVLRDGEWRFCGRYYFPPHGSAKPSLEGHRLSAFETRKAARDAARVGCAGKTRVRKVRVTVEEV